MNTELGTHKNTINSATTNIYLMQNIPSLRTMAQRFLHTINNIKTKNKQSKLKDNRYTALAPKH